MELYLFFQHANGIKIQIANGRGNNKKGKPCVSDQRVFKLLCNSVQFKDNMMNMVWKMHEVCVVKLLFMSRGFY